MNPFSRLSLTLLLALLIWSPVAYGVFQGRTDVLIAAIFFVGAVTLAYIGTGFLASLLTTYTHQQQRALEKARRVQREIEYMERTRRATDQQQNDHTTDNNNDRYGSKRADSAVTDSAS